MPRPKLSDSVIVVTGASSGIGRATALSLARSGATVLLAARREMPLRELAQECAHVGGRAQVVPTDVTDAGAVQRLADTAWEHHGRLDGWVNNAGVSLFGRFEEVPLEAFRRVIETNFFGYVHGARAALPRFREQGHGVLVNVSSVAGRVGQPATSAYCASKFAINGLGACLREELLDEDEIHVCTVLPGSVDTPLFQHAANYTGREVKPGTPMLHPARVARAIVSCLENPRSEVFVGLSSRPLALLQSLRPARNERQMARQLERDRFDDHSTPPTLGNLYEPMPEWTGTDGGWKRAKRARRTRIARNLLGAMGIAVPGGGLGSRLVAQNASLLEALRRR